MDEASRDRFDQALEEVRNYQKSVRNLSSTHRHAVNQGEIHYLINLTPLVDHEGHVKFVQGVMRDVTELRRIEMMKESLVRDVAHELKTPTAKFEMAVNWIEKEIQKEDALRKYEPLVEILKTNVDRLMRTITSIMDLSRLESGMDKIVKESLDLNEILGQVRRDMEPLCLQKGLLLDAKLAPEPLMVQGDRDMLYRLFVNLITNAIKFTPQGRIDLASRREGSHALASVTDTGIGLSPGDREIIFERFVQKTASSQGIGVGLTICRDIAALHDARIWADSPGPGRGSVFKVEFT
jgi:signal transduction histidine kinase